MSKKQPEHYGSGGFCVCPHCGTKVPHISGTPCMEMKCPQCGKRMVRENSEHHRKILEAKAKKQQKENTTQQNLPKIDNPKLEEHSVISKNSLSTENITEKTQTAPQAQDLIRVAFPTNDGVYIYQHVGQAEGFYIVELQGFTIVSQKFHSNPDKASHNHEHHHHEHHSHGQGQGRGMGGQGRGGHRRILNLIGDCDVFITRGMGRRLYTDLSALGIKILVSPYEKIKDALDAYLSNNLNDDPNSVVH